MPNCTQLSQAIIHLDGTRHCSLKVAHWCSLSMKDIRDRVENINTIAKGETTECVYLNIVPIKFSQPLVSMLFN